MEVIQIQGKHNGNSKIAPQNDHQQRHQGNNVADQLIKKPEQEGISNKTKTPIALREDYVWRLPSYNLQTGFIKFPYCGRGKGACPEVQTNSDDCECFSYQMFTTIVNVYSTGGTIIMVNTIISIALAIIEIIIINSSQSKNEINAVAGAVILVIFQIGFILINISFYNNRKDLPQSQWTKWLLDFLIIYAIISGPLLIPFGIQSFNGGMTAIAAISVIHILFYTMFCHFGFIQWFINPELTYENGGVLTLKYPIFAINTNQKPNVRLEFLLDLLNQTPKEVEQMKGVISWPTFIYDQELMFQSFIVQRSMMIYQINQRANDVENPTMAAHTEATKEIEFDDDVSEDLQLEILQEINQRLIQWNGYPGFGFFNLKIQPEEKISENNAQRNAEQNPIENISHPQSFPPMDSAVDVINEIPSNQREEDY